MVRKAKNVLYFTVASYFRFFARMRLARWHPRVVVVTGSNGKTTTLALVQAQLGTQARYSHGANSSFGIPFDILGLKRRTYGFAEWALFGLLAPIRAWSAPYPERIYVAEADCDRPGEGAFLSSLLSPEVVVWLSSARTHSMNFEKTARTSNTPINAAIAYEFGYFAERAGELVIVNGDEPLIMHEMRRVRATVRALRKTELFTRYGITVAGTEFGIGGSTYRMPFLLPEIMWYSIAAAAHVATHFGIRPNVDLWKLALPPSRSSLFKGVRNITIIDSTYNANIASMTAIMRMAELVPASEKWLVLGDMLEQGSQEREEHEKLAQLIRTGDARKIILVGPRTARYTLPLLADMNVVSFERPKDALEHIRHTLRGGETLVFKGARFLEGVVEQLLADPSDADKLCRREAVWQKRRAQWGL